MAGTYSKIYIHYVFVVKFRACLLEKAWRDEVFKYMAGVVKEKNQIPIIINGVEDHVHVFVIVKPSMLVSDLARDLKNNTSKFINERKFLKQTFRWQAGYGVFSYSHNATENVTRYIEQQEEHHKKQVFREEYVQLLSNFQVEYEDRFLFEDPQ